MVSYAVTTCVMGIPLVAPRSLWKPLKLAMWHVWCMRANPWPAQTVSARLSISALYWPMQSSYSCILLILQMWQFMVFLACRWSCSMHCQLLYQLYLHRLCAQLLPYRDCLCRLVGGHFDLAACIVFVTGFRNPTPLVEGYNQFLGHVHDLDLVSLLHCYDHHVPPPPIFVVASTSIANSSFVVTTSAAAPECAGASLCCLYSVHHIYVCLRMRWQAYTVSRGPSF